VHATGVVGDEQGAVAEPRGKARQIGLAGEIVTRSGGKPVAISRVIAASFAVPKSMKCCCGNASMSARQCGTGQRLAGCSPSQ